MIDEPDETASPPKHAGGRPTIYRSEFCAKVEEAMATGYSLTAFAGILGVARSTISLWMNEHEEFMEAVSRAKAKRLLAWETAAMKVAKSGGGPGTATIIVFGLKNMGGDEWADKAEMKYTGDAANPVQVVTRIERVIVDTQDRDG